MPLFEQNKYMKIDLRAAQAEFFAMLIFVYIGCGTATFVSSPQGFSFSKSPLNFLPTTLSPSFGTATALAFGLTITFLAYTIGHISGGHINCCVTWGLFCANKLTIGQLLANTLAQLVGSIAGAALLYASVPYAAYSGLGTNSLASGASPFNALVGEIVMTAVLIFVVLMTTSDEANKNVGKLAPFAIGFAVFAAHTVLLALDGCSINPSRSFGPALIMNKWEDFWVFVVGPYIGATFGALMYWSFQWDIRKQPKPVARSPSADQLLETTQQTASTRR